MPEKKSGLHKKISSIFEGMPDIAKEAKEISTGDAAGIPVLSPEPSPHVAPVPVAGDVPDAPKESSPQPSPSLPPAQNPTEEFLKQLRAMGEKIRLQARYAAPGIKSGASSSVIGLDLGKHRCKLIRLGKGMVVEGIAYHRWPFVAESSVEPGFSVSRKEALREMVHHVSGENIDTVLGIAGDAMTCQVLALPHLARAEMAKAVRWELTKKGTVDPASSVIDYTVLEQKSPGRKSQIFAVAAGESFVASCVETAKGSGLAVRRVDTIVQALQRVVRQGRLFHPGEDGAMLEMGYADSTLCLFRGDRLQFVRTFGLGGKDFLSAITGTLHADGQAINIGAEDALLLQEIVGIPSDAMLKTGPAKAFLSQITARMRPVLEDIAGELRRSVEHYVTSSGFGPVGTLYLSGGMARMKNLDSFLTKELGLSVKALAPFDRLGLSFPSDCETFQEMDQSSFTVPLGLALEGGHCLSLMPSLYRAQALDRRVTRWTKLVASVALAGMLAVGVGLQAMQTRMSQKIMALDAQCVSLAGPVSDCKKIQEIAQTIRDREELVVGNTMRQPLWEGVLKEISNMIPESVVLTELALTPLSAPKTLKIVGTIYADNLSVDSELSDFQRKMMTSSYFMGFDLVSRKNVRDATETPSSTFEIHGVLQY